MEYLNRNAIEGCSSEAFQTQKPYPWVRIDDALTPAGFQHLGENVGRNMRISPAKPRRLRSHERAVADSRG